MHAPERRIVTVDSAEASFNTLAEDHIDLWRRLLVYIIIEPLNKTMAQWLNAMCEDFSPISARDSGPPSNMLVHSRRSSSMLDV